MLRLSDPHALQPILRRCITILDFTGVLITYLWGRDCAVIGDHLQQASSRFELWLFGPVLCGCCRCAPIVHPKVLQPCPENTVLQRWEEGRQQRVRSLLAATEAPRDRASFYTANQARLCAECG